MHTYDIRHSPLVILLQEATRFGLVAFAWILILFIYMTSAPYTKQVFDFVLPTYSISGCVSMIILYIAFVVRLVVYTHITLEYFYSIIFHSLYSWAYVVSFIYLRFSISMKRRRIIILYLPQFILMRVWSILFLFAPVYTHEGMEYLLFICASVYQWSDGVLSFCICPSLYSWGYGVFYFYLPQFILMRVWSNIIFCICPLLYSWG
jgi:hypothetical protein